ncbi:MAG: CHASE3 domain-containing protein [Candidatus Acidiferrum sp.]
MFQRLNHRLIFASGIFLLLVCGSATAWILYRIYFGEEWVRHTYSVQLLVAEIESDVSETGRSRQMFLRSGDTRYLQRVEAMRGELLDKLPQLRAMVHDNLDEESTSQKLEQAVKARFFIVDESLQLVKSGKSTREAQDDYSAELVVSSQRCAALAQTMRKVEGNLLDHRLGVTRSLFDWIIVVLATSFLLSLYMLWEHFRGLNLELAQRKRAEQNALNLSAQLLNAQDQERRKIARDLHDGLGQNLVAAKMMADSFKHRPPDRQKFQDLSALLEEAVSSTRSISHLLHPPLVEELGFVAAARSYLEGFSKRTDIKVNFDLPDLPDRLPRDLELTLFRILQESITNIQRHSKSATAEVRFGVNGKTAVLNIQDHGVGLSPEMLENFNGDGSNVGVGLAGMKERVRERNGRFAVRSNSSGTLISASFPVEPEPSASS